MQGVGRDTGSKVVAQAGGKEGGNNWGDREITKTRTTPVDF